MGSASSGFKLMNESCFVSVKMTSRAKLLLHSVFTSIWIKSFLCKMLLFYHYFHYYYFYYYIFDYYHYYLDEVVLVQDAIVLAVKQADVVHCRTDSAHLLVVKVIKKNTLRVLWIDSITTTMTAITTTTAANITWSWPLLGKGIQRP